MSQTELTYSHVFKSPAQLKVGTKAFGLVSLGDLYGAEIGVHLTVVKDKDRAVVQLLDLLEAVHKNNSVLPLRIILNDHSSLSLRNLERGESEPVEANPDMGLRGVSRFVSDFGRPGFVFECDVLKRAIDERQLPIEIVVPFVRSTSEAATMIDLLAEQGLCRGANGLKVHLACQLPVNALLAETLLAYFDGLVIDVDKLAAFTLGVDFGNTALPYTIDKNNEAVRGLVIESISKAKLAEKPVIVLMQKTDLQIIELAESANVEIVFH